MYSHPLHRKFYCILHIHVYHTSTGDQLIGEVLYLLLDASIGLCVHIWTNRKMIIDILYPLHRKCYIAILHIHVYFTCTGNQLGEVLHLLLNVLHDLCVYVWADRKMIRDDILHPLRRKLYIAILHISVYHSYVY